MVGRALLVGIKDYIHFPVLNGAIDDANAMRGVLAKHADGSPNFSCQLLTSASALVDRRTLRKKWIELFSGYEGDILFYFAGHGVLSPVGGFLATQDGDTDDPGLPMDELLNLANHATGHARPKSVLLVLDCCHSGALGTTAMHQMRAGTPDITLLSEGVTVLAASRSDQTADEGLGGGTFTQLAIGALEGGAADLRGHVSAASIYAYVEQALGVFQQRPLYKTNAKSLHPVRRCAARISDEDLRVLADSQYFPTADHQHLMDPSYERTRDEARPENVQKFNYFKLLRNAGLLDTGGEDLYFIAVGDPEVPVGSVPTPQGFVTLSQLGQFYWRLAKKGLIA